MTWIAEDHRSHAGWWLVGGLLIFLAMYASSPRAEPEEFTLLVPADPGSGFDLTARAIAQALQDQSLTGQVSIEYSPGAGGVIGLAEFVHSREGQPNALFVGGLFTVGAVAANHSAVSLLETTPVARLAFDNAALVVPGQSGFKSAEDLIEAMISTPESISWVGGSRAGVDEINLHEIAHALGISPSRLHYTGLPGGGEVGSALAAGRFDAGISGFSEIEAQVRNDRLRLLAVIRNDGIEGIDVPEFESLGIGVKTLNWRGVFAPPDIDPSELVALSAVIGEMARSEEWQRLLDKHNWLDAYLAGPEFAAFVVEEQERVSELLADMQEPDAEAPREIRRVLMRRYIWAAALAGVSILLVVVLVLQRHFAHKREVGLQQAYEAATGEAHLHTEVLERALTDIQASIEAAFDDWNLTLAEREIASLLLKGLRLKAIADARGTSERTVRQQAQAIYKKAGLEGRFELAAYFIEDVIQAMEGENDPASGPAASQTSQATDP